MGKVDKISGATSWAPSFWSHFFLLKIPSLNTTSCQSYFLTSSRLKHITKFPYFSQASSSHGGRWQILILPWSGTYRRHESGTGAPKLRRGLSSPPSCIQHHHPSAPHPSSGLSQQNTGLCSSAQQETPRIETVAQKDQHYSLLAGNTAMGAEWDGLKCSTEQNFLHG